MFKFYHLEYFRRRKDFINNINDHLFTRYTEIKMFIPMMLLIGHEKLRKLQLWQI